MPEARPYQRVLALIRFDATDERIARKALLLARLNRAQLTFLHLAEPDTALDGGYPAASAKADALALEAGALRRLDFMAGQLGAGEARIIVRVGQARREFKQLLSEWQPDLVISAQEPGFMAGPHDLLVLGQQGRLTGGRTLGRLVSWLSAQFLPAAL